MDKRLFWGQTLTVKLKASQGNSLLKHDGRIIYIFYFLKYTFK